MDIVELERKLLICDAGSEGTAQAGFRHAHTVTARRGDRKRNLRAEPWLLPGHGLGAGDHSDNDAARNWRT